MCPNLCPAFSLVYSSVQSDLTRVPVYPDLCVAFSLTDAEHYTSPLIPSASPCSPVVDARLVLRVVLGPLREASA